MKDLMQLVNECKKELDEIDIEYRTVRNWTVNKRAKCRWGLCKKISEGVFDISISEKLLADEVDDIAAKNTIIHELLHTVKGSKGHKALWKAMADRVNRYYPQYRIKRCTSNEEKGIEIEHTPTAYKYKIRCKECGAISYRRRKSNVVQNIEKYRCGKCRGPLEVTQL